MQSKENIKTPFRIFWIDKNEATSLIYQHTLSRYITFFNFSQVQIHIILGSALGAINLGLLRFSASVPFKILTFWLLFSICNFGIA